MKTPKRRFLSFVFACLCLNKCVGIFEEASFTKLGSTAPLEIEIKIDERLVAGYITNRKPVFYRRPLNVTISPSNCFPFRMVSASLNIGKNALF